MGYLATKIPAKAGYHHLMLLFLLMPVIHLQAQTGPKHFLLVISKSNPELILNNTRENDIYNRHRETLQQLLNDGYLTLIGVLEQGGGVFSGNDINRLHVQNVLDKDRIIDAGIYVYQIKALDHERGLICPYKKECEEENYQLIKFLSNLNKETVKIAADMEYKHQLYLAKAHKNDQILLSGRFKDKDGSFVIYRGKDFRNFAYGNPAVINNYFVPEFFSFTGCSGTGCIAP